METAALIGGLASAVALVAALLFFARQAREAARQTRLANQIAEAQAVAAFYDANDRVIAQFLEYPDLRRYFYDGAELEDDALTIDSPIYARVLTLAELFADSLENSFDTTRTVGTVASRLDDLREYAIFVLGRSPILRQMVSEYATWYPNLASELEQLPAPTVRRERTAQTGASRSSPKV